VSKTRSGFQLFFSQPLPLTALLILTILIGGLLAVRSIEHWRNDIIESNMSLTTTAAYQLSLDAEEYLEQLPARLNEQGIMAVIAPIDSLDLQLTLLATRTFAVSPGLKGGYWLLQEGEFMGYANPWSPPPAPEFGPPPRSYPIILEQVNNTILQGEPIALLHQFESMSVSKTVFTLATEPVLRDGQLVAVAWARIHLENELPTPKLSRYLNITALIAVIAFFAALLSTMNQRREIRSLNENLQLIEVNPSHRLSHRRGMFGRIREAINKMIDSLEAENTRRLSLEEQLHQQDKMAALGNMLTSVAHEVKTPLAILKTRVQIWQRDLKQFSRNTGEPSPLTEESMQIVLHEIDRLSGLLSKLLYFSRPIRQDLMKPLEADDLIRHTILLVKPRLVQQRVDLDLNLAAPDAEIIGEPDALNQVFLNILTNSLQMIEENGRISVASRIDHDAGNLVIDLTDSGPGLPPEDRERVFTPFFTTRHGGVGLGLSISYQIVTAHQGTIEFIAPIDHTGAHCRVTLPLHQQATGES